MHSAVFLDRDGLINRKAEEHDYIKCWSEFSFLPDVPDAIARLNHAGYLVFVVTNQRGVARGLMSAADLQSIHEKMCAELQLRGAHIDGIYVCPHDIGQCHCRKPDIGLFIQAEQDFQIDKSGSWMVGDSDSDVYAGTNYGVKTIQTTKLLEAVERILEEHCI